MGPIGSEAFRSGASVVDRSDRGVLHFKGEQAAWFLDQLVTNKVEGLEPGEGVESLLLTPNGRIVAPMRLLMAGQSVFAELDPGLATGIKEFFEGRIFGTKVEIADRSADFVILTVLGPDSDKVVSSALSEIVPIEIPEHRDLGSAIPSETEHHTVHFGSSVVVRVTRPVRGVDLWARKEIGPQVSEALRIAGAGPATVEDFDHLCTIEGLPRFGVDYDDRYLLQEAALERAVHFAKGCYLGQEAVAMTQRGRVKKRLRHLVFPGGPAVKGIVMRDGVEVGSVGSIATENQIGYAIATVKTSVDVGSEVEVTSEDEARKSIVRELPNTSEGPKVPSARELRERLRE